MFRFMTPVSCHRCHKGWQSDSSKVFLGGSFVTYQITNAITQRWMPCINLHIEALIYAAHALAAWDDLAGAQN